MTRPPGPHPTERVRRPAMTQTWSDVAFLHWRYEAAEVRPLVPGSLELDTFDGSAWVTITPFIVENLRLLGLPQLPGLSRYLETNLRTYVIGPDGRRGVWFLSLESSGLLPVLGGRVAYVQPYMWSNLELHKMGRVVRYRGRRRLPRPEARYEIEVDPAPPGHDGLEDLDHFLTARWLLFAFYGSRLASVAVEHAPWPLVRARAPSIRESLTTAAGLPAPRGDPVVHFSEGVDTRIGPPRLQTSRTTNRGHDLA